MKFRVGVHGLALLMFIATVCLYNDSPIDGMLRRSLNERPVIYTFLERTFPDDIPKRTGMSEQDDEELLEKWKHYWTQAGWEPRVLTLRDAKAHPTYVQYVRALDGLPFGYYDRLCLIRWIAIAHVGGGWMSDYDTFPLEDFRSDGSSLPNDGRFTTYENIVPSLVSASGMEYLRLALLMADNARQHKNETHWSDMKALADLHKSSGGSAFDVRREVLGGIEALKGVVVWGPNDCADSSGQRAVHFSHHSMDKGITNFDARARDRPKVASEWLDMWKTSCSSTFLPPKSESLGSLKTIESSGETDGTKPGDHEGGISEEASSST